MTEHSASCLCQTLDEPKHSPSWRIFLETRWSDIHIGLFQHNLESRLYLNHIYDRLKKAIHVILVRLPVSPVFDESIMTQEVVQLLSKFRENMCGSS